MKIIESMNLTEQFRFPKSRKRRIRKKWARREENQRPIQGGILTRDHLGEETFICGPELAAQVRAQMDEVMSHEVMGMTPDGLPPLGSIYG